ncbi:outer membrane protein [Jiella sp. M17.18]|uniref:outer membrane protein n=1 Tax=Jiella sp. M17.18 TaxID=3234247 RepID=UPI0034DF9DF9
MKLLKILVIGAAATAAGWQGAAAADLPPLYAVPSYENVPEMQPVEVGTGWYLRGDVSYDLKADLKPSFDAYSTIGGSGPRTNLASGSLDGFSIDPGFAAGGGFGYQFTDYFRGDLTANYWQHDVSNATFGDFGIDSKAKAWELMANAYADLGTYVGFTPYVGGGIGAVHLDYDTSCSSNGSSCSSAFGSSTIDNRQDWRFAYALMAGVSYDVSKNLKIDVGYRYLNVGSGNMGKITAENAGTTYTIDGKDGGFDRHTFQAGIRYSLW